MDKQRHRLSESLNWLAALWLVGWALYVAFLKERPTFSTGQTMVELAVLLIPAALAYAVSWALDRYVTPVHSDHRAGLPH